MHDLVKRSSVHGQRGAAVQGYIRTRDFLSAVLFVAIGAVGLWYALGYPVGTLRRIGPGALPIAVSSLMIAVGTTLAIQVWLRDPAEGPLLSMPRLPEMRVLRSIAFVTASLIVFALLIRPMGLLVATFALAMVARQAEGGATIIGSVVLAAALSAISVGVFVYALGLPFRVWP